MNAIVGGLRAVDKLQQLFATATYSQNPTEQLVVCHEQAVHLASTLWEHGWPTWYALSYYHAQNTRWVHDVAPTVWRYQTLLMDIGAKTYLDGIEKYQHHMHLQTHRVAPLFFSPYIVVADNKTILDFIIRRHDSQSTDLLARQAEKNLPRMREWQRRLPVNQKIGSFTAYNIDIPNSYFARDIPSPLELVPLIRKIPNRQSPSSFVHSEEICSYEHKFTCIDPLQPPASPVPANDLISPPVPFDNAPSTCPCTTVTSITIPYINDTSISTDININSDTSITIYTCTPTTPTSQTMTSLTSAPTPSPPTPSDVLVPAASASLLLPTVTTPSSDQVHTTAVDAAQMNPPPPTTPPSTPWHLISWNLPRQLRCHWVIQPQIMNILIRLVKISNVLLIYFVLVHATSPISPRCLNFTILIVNFLLLFHFI